MFSIGPPTDTVDPLSDAVPPELANPPAEAPFPAALSVLPDVLMPSTNSEQRQKTLTLLSQVEH